MTWSCCCKARAAPWKVYFTSFTSGKASSKTYQRDYKHLHCFSRRDQIDLREYRDFHWTGYVRYRKYLSCNLVWRLLVPAASVLVNKLWLLLHLLRHNTSVWRQYENLLCGRWMCVDQCLNQSLNYYKYKKAVKPLHWDRAADHHTTKIRPPPYYPVLEQTNDLSPLFI